MRVTLDLEQELASAIDAPQGSKATSRRSKGRQMTPDQLPSPKEVEVRIAEVVALNRLCESLARAGRVLREPSVRTHAPVSGPKTDASSERKSTSGK
jgi:hypothetical protein